MPTLLPPGVHVYAAPTPSGYQPVTVEMEPQDGLEVGELALPEPQPLSIAGLDEQFVVYGGAVDASLPFMLTRNLGQTTLKVRVRYQGCTDVECFAPSSVNEEVVVSGLDLIRD